MNSGDFYKGGKAGVPIINSGDFYEGEKAQERHPPSKHTLPLSSHVMPCTTLQLCQKEGWHQV